MKKILLIIGFLFVSFIGFSQMNDNNGKSMRPIMSDIKTYIDTIESRGYEIVRFESDIVRADIPKESFRKLTAQPYRIIVFGDYRSDDMSIEVYKQGVDGNYEFVASDNRNESSAYVDVTPDGSGSGWYKFVVRCVRFKTSSVYTYTSCHYGLIIFHN